MPPCSPPTSDPDEQMRITALVCTRNRGTTVLAAVQSILENDHSDFEVIVVDQSTDDRAEVALATLSGDPRFRYIRSATVGLSIARNIGISVASSPVVAMTDDDCTVPRSWLSRIDDVFRGDPGVAMLLGSVLPALHDKSKGFVVGYTRGAAVIARGIRDKHRVEGMAACMAIRTDVWAALSGFDPMLGAGASLQSADETDMIIRSLLAGYFVCETPDIAVTHEGFRAWSDSDALVHGYLFGIGATIAKHLKCRHWGIAHVGAALARRWIFAQPVVDYGFKPSRRVRMLGFMRGFNAGLRLPVDRQTSQFMQNS
jgi:glycosyltransferase involved in cell wall biosynthesis